MSTAGRTLTLTRRLSRDERGLGVVEYVVMLVLVVALSVALWNLFGNEVSCRLAEAVVAFDDPAHAAGQPCREGTSGPAAAARGSARSASPSAGGSRGSAAQTSSAQAASAPGIPSPAARVVGSPAAVASTPVGEQSMTSRVANAVATVGEHAADLVEGAVAGANPLTPIVEQTHPLRPTFGHEVTYGVGQVVGALGGAVFDVGEIAGGVATGVGAVGEMVASGGLLTPVAAVELAAAGTQIAAAGASMVGHARNLGQGINYAMNGSEPPPKSSSTSNPASSNAGSTGPQKAPQAGKPPADGTTVLGHYPAYTEKAAELGSRPFSVPTEVWNKMSPTEQWAANAKFLDRMIARGDKVVLATQASKARPGSYFARELEYLASKGYRVADDGMSMIPPGR
jgi:Flp pilus assembly pilin Flp